MQKESASKGPFPFSKLPLDILVLVLDYLRPRNLLSLLHGDAITVDVLTIRHILAKEVEGDTILHLVSGLERKEWTESIVYRAPGVSSRGAGGETPLHIAARHGLEANVQLLIDAGAVLSAHCNSEFNPTPLFFALQSGNETIMRLLLSNGADVSQRSLFGEQPIHRAASGGHTGAIQLLLDNGADVSSMAKSGSALHSAIYAGNYDAAELLLQNGADLSIVPPGVEVPLYYAVNGGHILLVELLLFAGAKAHATTSTSGISPLHLAAGGGDMRTRGANYEITIMPPRAALRDYVVFDLWDERRYDRILQILLQADVDVSLPNAKGVTALHLAAFWGREKAVRMLLGAGADPSSKTTDGRTAGKIARINRHYGVCKLLGEPLPWKIWRHILYHFCPPAY